MPTINTPHDQHFLHSAYYNFAVQQSSLDTSTSTTARKRREPETSHKAISHRCEQVRPIIIGLPPVFAVFTLPLFHYGENIYTTASWTLGTVLGPGIGGLLSEPAKNYPNRFSEHGIFGRFVNVRKGRHGMITSGGLPSERIDWVWSCFWLTRFTYCRASAVFMAR